MTSIRGSSVRGAPRSGPSVREKLAYVVPMVLIILGALLVVWGDALVPPGGVQGRNHPVLGATLLLVALAMRLPLRPRRGLRLWIWGSCQALLLLAMILMILVVVGAPPAAPLFAALGAVLLAFPEMIFAIPESSKRELRGAPLIARWTYTSREWRAHWTRRAATGLRAHEGRSVWIIPLLYASWAGLVATYGYHVKAAMTLAIAAAGGAAGFLFCYFYFWFRRRKELRMIRAPRLAYIGDSFAWVGDEFVQWGRGLPMQLVKARVRPGTPSSIHLEFLIYVYVPLGHPDLEMPFHFEIPVPAGREGEAQEVVRRILRARHGREASAPASHAVAATSGRSGRDG